MARLSRKESQEATRAALRMAAAQEFARRGVSAASIDTIAEAAGFSRGAFYSNYSCKHDLLLELLQRIHKEELRAWREMIEHAATLDDAFDAVARRFDDFLESDSHGLLVTELRLEAQRNPTFGRHYAESSAEIFEMSVEMVRRLADKAGAPPGEVVAIAQALGAMAIGLELDARTYPAGSPSAGKIMALFLRRMLQA